MGRLLAAAIVSPDRGWARQLEGEVKPSYHSLEFYLLEDHEEGDEKVLQSISVTGICLRKL